jgi:hypothetical protein
MLWFLERESQTLICEVRQAEDGDDFELAVRTPGQPEHVERFAEPTVLIDTLVQRQMQLHLDGWRPKA